MRIDKIEVDGFGKLNQKSFSFQPGVNLIIGNNESGKSTLCEFLLAMFYEIPNDGKRLAFADSVRKRFRPWMAESFGGRVYFTDDEGTSYVLEKKIGKTKASDKVKLLYADTWDEAGDGENAGERFFGLKREGFMKTLYIRNLGVDGGNSEEILNRLSNMETSGDEEISYSKIDTTFEKAMHAISSKTGKGGKLNQLIKELEALKNEKQMFLHNRIYLKADETEMEELKSLGASLNAQREQAEAKLALCKEHEQYAACLKENEARRVLEERIKEEKKALLEAEAKRTELFSQDAEPVPQEQLDRAQRIEKELVLETSRMESYEMQKQQYYETQAKERKRHIRLRVGVSFGILGVLSVIGAILLFVAKLPALIAFGAGFAGAFVSYISIGKPKTERPFTQTNPQGELEQKKQELKILLNTYGVSSVAELYSVAAERKNKTAETEAILKSIEKLSSQIESLEKSLSELAPPAQYTVSEAAIHYEGPDSKELEHTISYLQREQELTRERYYAIHIKLAKETAEERSLADIESDIFSKEEEIEELEKQYDALLKAREWLTKAHEEIRQNFAPRLNEKTEEIFSCLTKGKYKSVRVGEGLRVHYKNEQNEIVEADYLSCGTYDLLYIALRLAMVDALSESTHPMLIADDTFLQLDDERCRVAAEYLSKTDLFGQVLYFTCHRESAGLLFQDRVHKIDLNEE